MWAATLESSEFAQWGNHGTTCCHTPALTLWSRENLLIFLYGIHVLMVVQCCLWRRHMPWLLHGQPLQQGLPFSLPGSQSGPAWPGCQREVSKHPRLLSYLSPSATSTRTCDTHLPLARPERGAVCHHRYLSSSNQLVHGPTPVPIDAA